jgi:hypothetical protein
VWDRKTRLDNISNGNIYEIVANYDANAEQNQAAYVVDETDLAEEEELIQEQPSNQREIYFPEDKKRHIYEQYVPKDTLESWVLDHHTYEDRQLCLEQPTHVSQRGGHYHVSDELHTQLMQVWKESVEKMETFYLEEIRTPTFRLYVDIDIKSTEPNDLYDIVQTGWLELITKVSSFIHY